MPEDFKNRSSFDAKGRVKKFQKKVSDELFLEKLNHSLVSLNENLEISKKSDFPILLVLGAPRSGTTLLTQMLCSRLDVGYPSNLMARFYNVPLVGARLHKLLINKSYSQIDHFYSTHGVTERLEEPHEFGYFWSKYLTTQNNTHEPDNTRKLDTELLSKELQSINGVFQKPTIYKCLLGAYFVPALLAIENIFILVIERNIKDLQNSILKVREERLGSSEKWWSLRPKDYSRLSKLEPQQQVKRQIESIYSSIHSGLKSTKSEDFLYIDYSFLANRPEKVLDQIISKVELKKGYTLKKKGEPLQPQQAKTYF